MNSGNVNFHDGSVLENNIDNSGEAPDCYRSIFLSSDSMVGNSTECEILIRDPPVGIFQVEQ